MIASTKITNTEIVFIALLVFKLLSCKVLFIIQIDKRNCQKEGYVFVKVANFTGKLLQNNK